MYTTVRNMTGDTFLACKDCGHAVSMAKICEKPIQSATDVLKHMAVHNASIALGVPAPDRVQPRSRAQQHCEHRRIPELRDLACDGPNEKGNTIGNNA